MSRLVGCGVLIAAIMVVSAGHAQPDTVHAVTIGQHGFMDADWYICPSWDVFQKFNKLKKDDSKAAFVLADRDCQRVRTRSPSSGPPTQTPSSRRSGEGERCWN